MTHRLEFLGWDRPFVHLVADRLFGERAGGGALDLGDAVVVVPTSRAGRRLVELLVDRCESRDVSLVPPRVVTTGELPGVLIADGEAEASAVERRLVWVSVLRDHPAEVATVGRPETSGSSSLSALASAIVDLQEDLAAGGLRPGDVPRLSAEYLSGRETERWSALCRLYDAYLRTLSDHGLADPFERRFRAAAEGTVRAEGPVFVAGCVDPNVLTLRLLGAAPDVTYLVPAPESHASRFTAAGTVVTREWTSAEVPLPDEKVTFAYDAEDQARTTVGILRAEGAAYCAEEITIGACDPLVVPHLEEACAASGPPLSAAEGRTVGSGPVHRLLDLVARYLDGRRARDLYALARHYDFGAYLRRECPEVGELLLELFDDHHGRHLPSEVAAPYRGPLSPVFRCVEKTFAPLGGGRRTFFGWAGPVGDLLARVFGHRALMRTIPRDARVIDGCEAVRAAFAEPVRGRTGPLMSCPESIRFLLGVTEDLPGNPPPDAGAVEVLGWLELLHDDARLVVVTGMNEGAVPGSVAGDPFLPHSLRERLGLVTNDDRFARDAFVLTALCRGGRDLRVIAGRVSEAAGPLMPSRLLYACPDETLAGRLGRFFDGSGRPPRRKAAAAVSGFLPENRAPEGARYAADSLAVGAVSDYLECPYRFYLKHVRRLRASGDDGAELGAASFGTIVHEVLAGFGRGPAAGSCRAEEILDDLIGRFDARFDETFGATCLPTVVRQAALVRARLGWFAGWQAARAAEGWKIAETEYELPADGATVVTPHGSVRLSGRVDRIDVRPETAEAAIIDYKTGDKARTPEERHRKGKKEEKTWTDVQLPVYGRVVSSNHPLLRGVPADRVTLLYVCVSADPDTSCESAAPWTADELDSAWAAVEGAVAGVLAGRFYPPSESASRNAEYDVLVPRTASVGAER